MKRLMNFCFRTVLYSAIGILSALFVPHDAVAGQAGLTSSQMRTNSSCFGVLKMNFGLGAGLDLGCRRSEDWTWGVTADVEALMFAVFLYVGPYGRRYLGNSFFVQGGLGYSEIVVNEWSQKGVSAQFGVGNEWQTNGGLLFGVDWIGAQILLDSTENNGVLSDSSRTIGQGCLI